MKVTFIEHSGFMVELESCALLFDYYQGEIPTIDEEKTLYVFSSHSHHDHFNPEILKLRSQYKKVMYILSDDIEVNQEDDVVFMGPREEISIDELKVRTLKSNDLGVAFLVEVEDKVIYHAGDLNWWDWNGEPDEDNQFMKESYQEEMKLLEDTKIDVAFVLLDPRQEDKYCLGMNYFLEHVGAKVVFPMHAFGAYRIAKHYLGCSDGRKYEGIVQNITKAGEKFTI